MDYLTEEAKFVCNQGGQISCKDLGNKKVTYNGKILLTTAADIKSKSGICAIKTAAAQGAPQPCSCQLTEWLPGFSPLKISSNKPLLMQSAKNFCPVGGSISVMTSGVDGHVATGNLPSSSLISAAKILDIKISDEQNKTSTAQKISDDKNNSFEQSKNFSAQKISAEQTEKKFSNIKFRCETENCRNKNCPHFKKNSFAEQNKISVPNTSKSPSEILRLNYYNYIGKLINFDGKEIERRLKDKNKELEFCKMLCKKIFNSACNDSDRFWIKSLVRWQEILAETNQNVWWYAAHHIIPKDQVFKKFPKCYRVANLISENKQPVFDINCAENCIMLLTNNQSAKYDTVFDTLKKYLRKKNLPQFIRKFVDVDMFELMQAVESEHEFKIQWHVGNHGYEFKKAEFKQAEDLFKKKFPGKDIISYEKAICNKMEIIENKIDLNDVCPMEIRKDFINLIKKIRSHLNNFAKNPCASYPFFVTKDNYFFALLN